MRNFMRMIAYVQYIVHHYTLVAFDFQWPFSFQIFLYTDTRKNKDTADIRLKTYICIKKNRALAMTHADNN